MPLITSTTQLNKWKFGKGPWSDKRGGGNSNQPYISRDIPGVQYNNPNQTFESVAEGDLPVRSGPDFLLRNGFLAPADAARDVSRLSQMFFDLKSPNGLLFIAKENLLSRTSVSTQASGGPGYGIGTVNQGIYTPLSTLGQAATGFTGNHLNLLGLDPSSPKSGIPEGGLLPGLGLQTYEDAIKRSNLVGNFVVDNNRLTALYDNIANNTSAFNFGFVRGYNLLPNNVQGSPLLISYGGGPGSVLGIGKTNIRFADQRTGDQNNLASSNPTYFYTGSRPNSKTISNIKNPTLGGASTTYENIIGETGSLGLNEYDTSGGYTTTPTFDYLTTETTSSLTPRGDIDTYQTSRWNSRTISSWISPIVGGASATYENIIGETGSLKLDEYNSNGGYTTTPTFDYLTTETTSSLTPRGDIGTYQTSRWNSRTTSSWISPITGGTFASASITSKFLDSGGFDLNLFNTRDGGVLSTDGGYSYTQNWNNNTVLVDPSNPTLGTYQTSRWNSRTTSSFISPIAGGIYESSSITSKFLDSGGFDLNLFNTRGGGVLSTDGGYSYTQNWEYNVSLADPSNPRLDTYQTTVKSVKTRDGELEGGTRVNYTSSLNFSGSITDQILESGVTLTNDGIPYYAKATEGPLFNKNENQQLTHIASLPASVKTRDGELEGGIRINYSSSISPSGLGNLYKTLTGAEIDNNYTDKYFFNVYDPSTTPGNTWPTNTPLIYANGTKTFSQQQLINKENVIEGDSSGLYPTDFRKELYNVNEDNLEETKESSVISLSPDYRSKNKDVRLYMGQPGKSNNANMNKNVWNYGIKATDLTALDKITAMPMYEGTGPDTNQAVDDLVKFRIAAIDNNKTDGSAVYMHFRAFLDSFSDSYTATWNPVNYVGRGDTLFNYGGFGRTISLSFTTAAQSKAELIPMYKKLNYLASTLAPDYTGAGFMRGNMVRLTVGGYLYEQPGFITSLTYDVPQESSWEIAINETGNSDNSVKELPHMIKVSSFAFTPIHNFLAQKPNDPNNPTTKFISLSNGVNSNYDDVYRTYTGEGNGGGDNNIAT